MMVPEGPTEAKDVSKCLADLAYRVIIATICGINAYLNRRKPDFYSRREDGAHLSTVWRTAIPKVAMMPINSAATTQPTAIVKPPPLMAENI